MSEVMARASTDSDGTTDELECITVLDSLGDEYYVYFRETPEGLALHGIVLPKDGAWTVEVFQTVVEIRDDVVEHLEENGENVFDATFDLTSIHYYAENPFDAKQRSDGR
jgi:hypothetical protein